MKKRYSLISLGCALLSILLLLASCKSPSTQPLPTSQSKEVSPITVPKIGREIVIGTDYTPPAEREISSDCFAEEEMKAIAHVEQLYSVTIRYVRPDSNPIYKNSWAALSCDLICNIKPQKYAYDYAYGLILSDLTAIESVDLDSGGYHEAQKKSDAFRGRLYACVSDFTLGDQSFYAVLCNRDLYQSLGYEEDLYTLTQNGNWTIEKQKELSTLFASTDHDDKIFLLQNQAQLHLYMYSQGITILHRTSNDILNRQFLCGVKDDVKHENLKALTTAGLNTKELLDGENVLTTMKSDTNLPESDEWRRFVEGDVLFTTVNLNPNVTSLQGVEFAVSFLPVPKAEQQAPYRSYASMGYCVIPKFPPNVEESGLILQALSDYADQHMEPKLNDTILSPLKKATDTDRSMLDYLRTTALYDFGAVFDGALTLQYTFYYTLSSPADRVENAIDGYLYKNQSISIRIEQDANEPIGN